MKLDICIVVVLLLIVSPLLANPHERWESHIAAFEQLDREHPPEPGGILFVGSSSIVGWDTDRWFDDLNVVNRGFGGSEIADSVHFAPRFIHPHRPDIVVLYAGDNDIANGKSAGTVLADFDRFVEAVRETSPEAEVVFIAIKPSVARRQLMERMHEANMLVRERCEEDERLHYADIFTPSLDETGEPNADLLIDDGLHLNEAGYTLWTQIVRDILDDLLQEEKSAE